VVHACNHKLPGPHGGLRNFQRTEIGFRVPGFGIRDSGFGIRVPGFGIRVSGFRFQVSGFGIRDPGFSILVSSFGIRDSGFGIREPGFGIRADREEDDVEEREGDDGVRAIQSPRRRVSGDEDGPEEHAQVHDEEHDLRPPPA